MRNILHVDLNAFFASVEQSLNPELCEMPVAVGGDKEKRTGIILTASYEARKYGVKTGMIISDAKKLCPDIVIVKPHFQEYLKFSNMTMDILRSYTPDIEQFSIDEAWLDVTGCDRIFGSPEQIAYKIRNDIRKQMNITASVGVSYCKVMAKMASDMKKPDATTIIMPEDVKTKIWPLGIGQLFGVGRRMRVKLNDIGIKTIGNLANFNEGLIEKKYGKMGKVLWYYANGIDDSPVHVSREQAKGIGNSTTTASDIVAYSEASEIIMELCESVCMRMRTGEFEASVVEIVIKTSGFEICTRQRKMQNYTSSTYQIYSAAEKLLYENWDEKTPLRLIGVRVTGLKEKSSYRQISIFENRNMIKNEELDNCIDKIREKYGYKSIVRGNVLTMDDTKLSGNSKNMEL